jgi:hypothetical protein
MQKQVESHWGLILVMLAVLAVAGCGHSRTRPMAIASNAGAKAIELYDANKDGVLDYKEMAETPGLRSAVARIKKIGNRRGPAPSDRDLWSTTISADDIDERIKEWKARGTGRIAVKCCVLRGGVPLVNAEVNFVPEEFLGSGLPTGTGTTDAHGIAVISQPSQGGGDTSRGMSPGLYRVEITKGEEIPVKYNKSTIFGQEVATDVPGILSTLVFNLD